MNITAQFGHNETTVRLGLLADDARHALERVASGESTAIDGWLAYGAALNEGRAMFTGDLEFGQWVRSSNLEEGIHPADRSAAMWAAANPEQFTEARAAGNARTVRGIHAKWGEIDAERKAAAERARAEAERAKAEAERAEAEAARRQAEAARREAQARADAEAEAQRAAARAKSEAERKVAQARALAEADAKAAAQRKAREADAQAKASMDSAKKSDKAAVGADKAAKSADRKAEKARNGVTGDAHVSNNSGENEWYTPAVFIEAARAAMGGIDLDPASSEVANRTVKASQIFTAQDDGLAQDWPIGRIWMNPPYAQPLMGQFAQKLADEARRGSEAIVLVNNATETAWFQVMGAVCSAICFPKSRIRFLDPEGNPGAPLQGQAIIYCGDNRKSFERHFAQFGMVVWHG